MLSAARTLWPPLAWGGVQGYWFEKLGFWGSGFRVWGGVVMCFHALPRKTLFAPSEADLRLLGSHFLTGRRRTVLRYGSHNSNDQGLGFRV